MDIVERLTLEAAQADTMLAREHRHRYEFAARFCRGLRAVDLCCGSGYGSALLAGQATEVLAVDNDAATIETATVTVGAEHANVRFALADALTFLRGLEVEQVDAVVCFEGLEHLPKLKAALDRLGELAQDGVRLLLSVPNSRMFEEQNSFHLTDFGYDEARAAFSAFPGAIIVPQFLAEGSLICPPGATETEFVAALSGYDEPEYANHFICCVGFDADAVARATLGNLQLSAAPLFNRWAEGMKHALHALRRENARLARGRLGKSGSAAATALAAIEVRESEVAAVEERWRCAEARVRELEGQAVTPPPPDEAPPKLITVDSVEAPLAAEARAPALAAWIESALPLDGRTVLALGPESSSLPAELARRGGRLVDHQAPAADVVLLEGATDSGTLSRARERMAEDGAVVVCGAHNRLVWGADHGIGFAEFEAAFGDLGRHVIASGYDVRLLGGEPVRPEEISLARHLDRVRPDLPPAFSRPRIDLILVAAPRERRPVWMRPWTADTSASPGAGWTREETIRLRAQTVSLRIQLPAPSARLLVGLTTRDPRPFSLTLGPDGGAGVAVRVAPTLGRQVFLDVPLPEPAREIEMTAGGPCEIVLVAYES